MVLLDMEIMFLFLVVPVARKFSLSPKSRTLRAECNVFSDRRKNGLWTARTLVASILVRISTIMHTIPKFSKYLLIFAPQINDFGQFEDQ